MGRLRLTPLVALALSAAKGPRAAREWDNCGAVRRWLRGHRGGGGVGNNWAGAHGGALSFSQYGQDVVVLSLVHALAASEPEVERVYLDVAANDARLGSNTYLLDKCFKWRGVCVEPNVAYHKGIRDSRSCNLVDTCVSDSPRTVEFENAFFLGHIVDGAAVERKRRRRRLDTTTLRCVTIGGILALGRLGRVTYLSLDVEGHELPALRGIDWNATLVDALTLENAAEEHYAFLDAVGLAPFLCLGIDTLFVRRPLLPAADAWHTANRARLEPLCAVRDTARCLAGDERNFDCSVRTGFWNAWQR